MDNHICGIIVFLITQQHGLVNFPAGFVPKLQVWDQQKGVLVVPKISNQEKEVIWEVDQQRNKILFIQHIPYSSQKNEGSIDMNLKMK